MSTQAIRAHKTSSRAQRPWRQGNSYNSSNASLFLQQAKAFELLDYGINASSADGTEILLLVDDTGLTRFTNLAIHQNVESVRTQAFLRTIWDNRLVIAEVDELSKPSIKSALARSEKLARNTSPSRVLPDLRHAARSKLTNARRLVTYNEATAKCGPGERAAFIERACGVFRQSGVNGCGNVRIQRLEMAVGNSAGLRRYAPFSIVGMVVTGFDEDNWSSGYQNWVGRDVEALNPEELARQAAMKCIMGRNPQIIEARPMTAILEPPAVAQLLFHLNFRSLGLFGAQSAVLRENFLYDHLGEQVTSDKISIADDTSTEGLVPMPFDFEGVEKKRIDLVANGIAGGIGNNLVTASVLNQGPTGHAQPPGNAFGPTPQHLVVEPGTSNVADMIASTEYGVLVSRIHGFVNPLSSKQGYLGGTTRDGLFLVQNGRITGPIRNFRWMDRIFSAFETTEAVSQERIVQFTDELWFPTFALVPTIKLGRFQFVDEQRWRE